MTDQPQHNGRSAGPPSTDEMLRAALWWASRGLAVFPCQVADKRPVTVRGFKDAATLEERIHTWWAGRPYNIAAATGSPGPDVLDVEGVDKPGGSGWEAFARLKAAGLLTGARMLVRTPSKGAHLYFEGSAQRSGSLSKQHIDFKSTGGYVLLPPSQVNGRRYELVDDRPRTGASFDFAAAKRLLEPPRPVTVRRPFRSGPGSAKHLVAWLEGETEGNRNKALHWAACRAFEAGDESVISELAAVAIGAGLGNDEVHKTIDSAYRRVSNGGHST
jgi:hypothetical protein